MRRIAACLVVFCLCGASPKAAEGEIDAALVLARFQVWLDGTHDLRARFVQRMVSGALGEGLEESGRLFLKRPGLMRWDYLAPEVKVALVRQERTVLYLEEDRQLWEGTLEGGDSLLPTLLSGARPVGDLFEAELEAPSPGDARTHRLRLLPRTASESLERIVLTLGVPSFAIREIEVLDAAGNRMLYRFSRLERNAGLPDATFHFEPPAGTEIVLRAPAP